jgi:hypothetical protein
MEVFARGPVTPEAQATVIASLIGGAFALLGVWIGFYLSRRASEGDRKTDALSKIYLGTEMLRTLVRAFQKKMIDQSLMHRKWNNTTEGMLMALVRSGLDKKEKKRVLHTINVKWGDPQAASKLRELADELLNRLDPEFAKASKEMLAELGVTPDDIDPVIL